MYPYIVNSASEDWYKDIGTTAKYIGIGVRGSTRNNGWKFLKFAHVYVSMKNKCNLVGMIDLNLVNCFLHESQKELPYNKYEKISILNESYAIHIDT